MGWLEVRRLLDARRKLDPPQLSTEEVGMSGRFRVTINGFKVLAETWDDILEWDGKRDEVLVSTSVTMLDKDGKELFQNQPTSPVMGDTRNLPGRVRAGSASTEGGLMTGDSFPTATPWYRSSVDPNQDWPPMSVWEGDLVSGENVAVITPTIWEWDPGGNAFVGWIQWANSTTQKLGAKAKELLGASGASVVDAVSLGLGVAVTLLDVGGPVGVPGSRPIGMKPDPADANGTTFVFNPWTLALSYEKAELIANSEPSGRGKGILTIRYIEHPYFRGDYVLYVQVERVGAGRKDGGAVAWEPLAHSFTSAPAVCSSAKGKLEVFGRGTDQRLYWRRWDGSSWGKGWVPVGPNPVGSDPAAVASADGKIHLAVRGTDGAPYYNRFDGRWSRWYPLGGVITSSPAIATLSPDRLVVLARGLDKTLKWTIGDGKGWRSWMPLPGGNLVESDPSAVSSGDGQLDVAVLGTDRRVYHRPYRAGTWGPWKPLGNFEASSGPAIVATGQGNLVVFARGMDTRLYWNRRSGGSWKGWKQLGDNPIAGDPAATSPAAGRVDVFVRGSDNAMYHRWHDGNWHP